MLRRITRNRQVTIPKEFMARLHLKEGDYVNMEFGGDSIRLRAVHFEEFSPDDYRKLASKLDQLKKGKGKVFKTSSGARKHLKGMMK